MTRKKSARKSRAKRPVTRRVTKKMPELSAAVAETGSIPGANAIVDLSHHNAAVDFDAARAAGIVAAIHKTTQGDQYVDPTYAPRRPRALASGMLWGAYHFGVGADGGAQADHFLATVGSDAGTLRVLDFEANPQGPSMTLAQARAFVTRVFDRTGRWPGLYSGHYLKELLNGGSDPVLQNCWLWLSQYGSEPVIPPNWSRWTLWQYTDGGAGPPPHEVPGIGRCDRDTFNGTLDGVRQLWSLAR
jgi:lysozyme